MDASTAPPEPHADPSRASLFAREPRFAAIETRFGPLPWRRRPGGFPGLLAAIVGQQISSQAAAAIWRRLAATEGALTPDGLLALPDEKLREAGLSRPKITHARALATAFATNVLDANALATLDDAAVVAAIAGVRGLGVWSGEIYLLFALDRPDVFPAGDLALAAAAANLLELPARPGPVALRRLAAAWAPCRGLAARLLWHHWRGVTGRKSFDD